MFISPTRRTPATPKVIALAAAITGSPYLAAWDFDADTGWGEKFPDPSGTDATMHVSPSGIGYLPRSGVLIATTNTRQSNTFGDPGYNQFGRAYQVDQDSVDMITGSNVSAGKVDTLEELVASTSTVFRVVDGLGVTEWSIPKPFSNLNLIDSTFISTGTQVFTHWKSPSSNSWGLYLSNRDGSSANTGDLGFDTTSSPINSVASSTKALANGNFPVAYARSNGALKFLSTVPDSVTFGSETGSFASGITHVAFTGTGMFIGVSNTFMKLYEIDSAGASTEVDSVALSLGTINDISIDPETDVVFLSHSSSPYVSAWPVNQSGFGTKYADPATLSGSQATQITPITTR